MELLRGAALVADAGNDVRSEATDVPSGADKTVATILGEIVWLMSQSAEFKQYLISDLEWLVMPPILLRQFRLFYHEGRPAGAVLFARVSSEVAGRLDFGAPTMRVNDWKSGELLKIVKIIAPFGGGDKFLDQTQDFLSRLDVD
ncbi:toxin-activating lysine-acyltransferase [Bosea sp. RCC_152_1]|uniref:toxin-activating lysine-acyltransferase n=1 Tax=Bosea sp. RCC_152_1 TaxID=3239228 RepID=UPI0035259265